MENKNLQSVLSEMNEYTENLQSKIRHYDYRIEFYNHKIDELYEEDPDFWDKKTVYARNKIVKEKDVFIHKKILTSNFLTKLADWQEKLENS